MKTYLGDGCYVDFDGYSLTLTTENGVSTTNCIVLESSVYGALVAYVDKIRAGAAIQRESEFDGDEDRS